MSFFAVEARSRQPDKMSFPLRTTHARIPEVLPCSQKCSSAHSWLRDISAEFSRKLCLYAVCVSAAEWRLAVATGASPWNRPQEIVESRRDGTSVLSDSCRPQYPVETTTQRQVPTGACRCVRRAGKMIFPHVSANDKPSRSHASVHGRCCALRGIRVFCSRCLGPSH